MKNIHIITGMIFALIFTIFPISYAEPMVNIIMEKTTYSYCEKLFYTIEVSEVTEEIAIIHIRDEAGQGSSAIPFAITDLQNPVPSLVPFEKEIFPLGKYFVDVEYAGVKTTAEFELIDSGKKCIPGVVKPIMSNWLSGNISDGFLVDSFKKFVDPEVIDIPYEIDETNVYEIDVPEWMKFVGFWWLEGLISDDEFANVVNYLLDKKIISFPQDSVNEI